jgi:hypothetical protein
MAEAEQVERVARAIHASWCTTPWDKAEESDKDQARKDARAALEAELPQPRPIDLVREAHAHLGAALMQVIDKDDRIIVDHLRSAHVLLRALLDATRKH